MTTQSLPHLSQEAFDDLCIGLGTPESEAHIAICGDCRAKLAEFQSDVMLLKQASLAWSEARPRRIPPRVSLGRAPFAAAGLTGMAVVLFVIVVTVGHHNGPGPEAFHAPVVESQTANNEAQIAADNELLREVDAAISDDESPIDQYLLESQNSRSEVSPK